MRLFFIVLLLCWSVSSCVHKNPQVDNHVKVTVMWEDDQAPNHGIYGEVTIDNHWFYLIKGYANTNGYLHEGKCPVCQKERLHGFQETSTSSNVNSSQFYATGLYNSPN